MNQKKAPRPPKGGEKFPGVINSADPALYAKLEPIAKNMRDNPTKAEELLWNRLRNNQTGIKFRQQHIINKFIVDFCSIKTALIVEVEGEIHNWQIAADEERKKILEGEGYRLLKFTNEEVINNCDEVIDIIIKTILSLKEPE